MTHNPPDWAQSLVSLFVPARTRDSVVGDLLEEYRDTQVPSRGESGADVWYCRQALAFVWTASAPAGFAVAGTLTVRMLTDVLAPSAQPSGRAWITTLLGMGIFAFFGFRLGRSTGRIAGAVVMAIAATVVATMAAYAATLLALGVAAAFVSPNAAAWAGLREGLDIPAHVIGVIGIVLASAGAAIGRPFTDSSGSSASIRT